MGEESSSPPRIDATSWNLHDFLEEASSDIELSSELHVEEELVEEVMEELYREMTCSPLTPTTCNVNIPSSLGSIPSPPLLLPDRMVFVDDGQSESCGASVSDSSSTVMAGVESCVVPGVREMTGKNVAESSEGDREWVESCGGVDRFDEEWLERVIRWVPLELEAWTC